MRAEEQLATGLAALGLSVPSAAQAQLLRYLDLLLKWNRVYNLTAIRDRADVVSHHLLDSMAILPHLPAVANLADIGSGAGLPGIPVAIDRPDSQVVLVEAVGKKCSFMQQAKIELGLANVSIHCGRAEALTFPSGFDAVVSRAFSELRRFIDVAGHLVAKAGRLYAMKGVYPGEELAQLPAGWRLAAAPSLQVPGLAGQRHLIILERH
jgi:16S rRNA (guanine527-N7)-methyltransferase